MPTVLHGFDGIRVQRLEPRDGVGADDAIHVREYDRLAAGELLQSPEMALKIVRGDHEIVRARGAELTAGRDLQPVVVPLGHDRQLQPQHGNLDIADIIIAVDRDGRHRRVYRRRRRRHARTRRRLPDSLRLDDRLDALEQALGLLPGLCVLLTVMDEEEQR